MLSGLRYRGLLRGWVILGRHVISTVALCVCGLSHLARFCCAELDQGVLFVLFGSQGKPKIVSKRKCLRLKYILFATETAAWPLLPIKPANLLRYALWLPQHGIHSGWRSVSTYVSAACKWQKELGWPDPRKEISFYWDLFRHNFQRLVVAKHPAMKLPVRPAMVTAMTLDADLTDPTDLRDIAAYQLLFYTGFRIGSITASEHALKFEDLYFYPSIAECQMVLICLRSTKTRPRAAGLPFWTAIRRQPQLRFCPVALLLAHFLSSYRQRPGDNLFMTPDRRPWPRTSFNATLRRRLAFAQRRLGINLDISKFSGISFRKGCLSTLGALNVPAHRLADHADHSSVESSRVYTVDTMVDRAANSDLIASRVLAG